MSDVRYTRIPVGQMKGLTLLARAVLVELSLVGEVHSCGVVLLNERRLNRALGIDGVQDSEIRSAVEELEAAGLVVLDDDTYELLLIAHVENNFNTNNGPIVKGILGSLRRVESLRLIEAFAAHYPHVVKRTAKTTKPETTEDSMQDTQTTEPEEVEESYEDSPQESCEDSPQAAWQAQHATLNMQQATSNKQHATAAAAANREADSEIPKVVRLAARAAAAAKSKNPPETVNHVAAWRKGIEKKILTDQIRELLEFHAENPAADEFDLAIGAELCDRAGVAHLRNFQRIATAQALNGSSDALRVLA